MRRKTIRISGSDTSIAVMLYSEGSYEMKTKTTPSNSHKIPLSAWQKKKNIFYTLILRVRIRARNWAIIYVNFIDEAYTLAYVFYFDVSIILLDAFCLCDGLHQEKHQ